MYLRLIPLSIIKDSNKTFFVTKVQFILSITGITFLKLKTIFNKLYFLKLLIIFSIQRTINHQDFFISCFFWIIFSEFMLHFLLQFFLFLTGICSYKYPKFRSLIKIPLDNQNHCLMSRFNIFFGEVLSIKIIKILT